MSTAPDRTSNVPEFSVSELAFSLKKTLEGAYSHVRVRGELSRIKIHSSGHMYSVIKDDNACIDAVCWKSNVARLSIKPEEGLEVICTGRISTYPARSNYQLIIESMELAGEGALLKMLEDRKRRLAAEGLFAPERKKKLPFLPERIGVITSPTGAVIRDIMHRLNDRFPRHVMLWPVHVQGDTAAAEIERALRGFCGLPESVRPGILILARGGGSLEDLMPFNEENVVRAVADCTIPIITAVGHETDTTLVDYASDLRAPTPTGAAEMAVPRRLDLLATVRAEADTLLRVASRLLSERKGRLETLGARLGDPARLLEIHSQKVDHLGGNLERQAHILVNDRRARLQTASVRLRDPGYVLQQKTQGLVRLADRLDNGFRNRLNEEGRLLAKAGALLREPRGIIERLQERLLERGQTLQRVWARSFEERRTNLAYLARSLENLSYENVLGRGYAVVFDVCGKPITSAHAVSAGMALDIKFRDGRAGALASGKSPDRASLSGQSADREKQLDQGKLL